MTSMKSEFSMVNHTQTILMFKGVSRRQLLRMDQLIAYTWSSPMFSLFKPSSRKQTGLRVSHRPTQSTLITTSLKLFLSFLLSVVRLTLMDRHLKSHASVKLLRFSRIGARRQVNKTPRKVNSGLKVFTTCRRSGVLVRLTNHATTLRVVGQMTPGPLSLVSSTMAVVLFS